MKTIEQAKQEFKAATGYNMPIYTYNGESGVLYDVDCVTKFIPMDEFLLRPSVNYDDVRWVTVGADGCEEGEEITDAAVRNEENEEKLLVDCVWSPVDYNKSDEFVRELLVTTTQYYAWTSERRRMIDAIQQTLEHHNDELGRYNGVPDEGLEQDDIKKRDRCVESLKNCIKSHKADWEKTCSNYEDPLGWRDYEHNTIDFENVYEEAISCGRYQELSDIVTKVAREAIENVDEN